MKKNKFLAILSAITITVASSIPLLSSAIHFPDLEKNSIAFKKFLENYEHIDDKGIFESYAENDREEYRVYKHIEYDTFYVVSIKDNIASFVPLDILKGEFGDDLLTSYSYYNDSDVEEKIKMIQDYIDENNLNCTVVKSDDSNSAIIYGYKVIPDNKITFEEHVELASKLKEDLGLVPCLTGIQGNFLIKLESIIAGDVNLDGKVDIADIVAISAYTGDAENNSFKSEQQIINGDVHNTGDGLTANDALMIQQYLAGMIDGLE